MIITVNSKTYIVQFRKEMHECETKCVDKYHRKVTIQWDELTVTCTISEVYRKNQLQKTVRYEGTAKSSYLDTISVPVGRWIALKRAVSLMKLPVDEAAHIVEEVKKQTKLVSIHPDKIPPKAYVELKFVQPKPKSEEDKKKRAELKALTDAKYKEYLEKKEKAEQNRPKFQDGFQKAIDAKMKAKESNMEYKGLEGMDMAQTPEDAVDVDYGESPEVL